MKESTLGKPNARMLRLDAAGGEEFYLNVDGISAVRGDIEQSQLEDTAEQQEGRFGKLGGGEDRPARFPLKRIQIVGAQASLWLSPPMPGDIVVLDLANDQTLNVMGAAFLACETSLTIDDDWSGMHLLMERTGQRLLQVYGEGRIWLCSFGAHLKLSVEGKLRVDPASLMAYPAELNLEMDTQGDSYCSFSGFGTLHAQSGRGDWMLERVQPFRRSERRLR